MTKAPGQGTPILPDPLVEVSLKSGGRGVALKNSQPLGAVGPIYSIGQSPGPGTNCSVYLATNMDHAYDGAILYFYVRQFGRTPLWTTRTIDAAYNAAQAELAYTVGWCAGDFWLVSIQLTGSTTPAIPLASSCIAYGEENTGGGASSASGPYTASGGPGAFGSYDFSVPDGTSTYLITMTAKVTTAGGAGEAVGDSYVSTVVSTWKSVSGAVSVLTPTLSAPDVSTDTSMAAMDFGPSDDDTTQAVIPWVIPGTLDAGTVVAITIVTQLLSTG